MTLDPIVYGMPMHEYRAVDAVSNSDLSNLKRSPAYAKWRRENPDKDTPAKALGTAAHMAVLEPELFEDLYRIDPESPKGGYPAGWRNTKVYKEEVGQIQLAGKRVIKMEDHARAMAIRDSVHSHEIGAMIARLNEGSEVSVFAEDDGLFRKCRPDIVIPDRNMIVDLKTAEDVTPGGFSRAAHRYGYHRSAAYYTDTIDMGTEWIIDHYVFLVVCSSAPFEARTYTLDQDSVEQGRFEYEKLLESWRMCAEAEHWPASTNTIEEIRIPEFSINYYDERKSA